MKPKLSKAATRLIGQPMFSFLAKVKERERAGEKMIHFEIGDPSFSSPSQVIKAAKDSLDSGETHYTDSMGLWDLRLAVTDFVNERWGFKPKIGQVVILPANAAIDFVIRSVANQGDEVILPDPGFPTYSAVTNYTGIKAAPSALKENNQFRMNPSDVSKKISSKTRLIISNSPNNPTGSVMTENEVRELYELAKKKDLYLLSDEVYKEIYYENAPASPVIFDKCEERTILLYSFSKTFAMSGWRLGFLVCPEKIAEKIGLMIQTVISCMPVFNQRGALAALKLPPSYFDELRNELKARRDFLVSGLNKLPGVSCLSPQGAFYAFPNVSGTGMTGQKFMDLMFEKAGVAVLDGAAFGKAGKNNVRLSYASTTKETMAEALKKMAETLKR